MFRRRKKQRTGKSGVIDGSHTRPKSNVGNPYPLAGSGVPSAMECEPIVAPKPVISYKDMITGGNVSPSLDESIDLDDDDIELLEEDICRAVM
ncbi:hypothetical protein V6N13_139787 [Hibiscus sabdariffa]|uniref:Uncharacterized protein n=2 Tax=Hibiscus sabdariffa TaxID=183260 RepID=A0ABR2ADI9_9ROSI